VRRNPFRDEEGKQLLGGLLTASYFGLAHVQKWAAIPEGAGLALNSENTWKGVLLSAGTILTSAFLLGVLQLFWWSARTRGLSLAGNSST